MNTIIKLIANYLILVPVLASAYLLFKLNKQRRIEFLIILVAGGVLSLILAKLGSALVQDPRPFVVGHFTPLIPHSADNGFPSDHTLLSSFLGYAILRYSKKLGIAMLLVAALIGASRVAAGVHHPLDILGSFVIAGIACLVVAKLFDVITKKKAGASVQQ
jgi:undecaprenyl-diphosphatase